MKYAVTHCTFDGEAGANPLWHSCILLSRMNENTKQLEVVDNWGFYGVPTTNRDNSWINQLKLKMGLDVDLEGNHGMLRHEETRFLDLGRGLHGATFELTEEQFKHLQKKCLEMYEQQQAAINEIVIPLGLKEKPAAETKMYPHENRSLLIYQMEKIRAEENNRESRLKPFEIRVSLGLTGLDFSKSNTCKSQSIALLQHVLSEQQIARLTNNGKYPSIPKYSGPTESIYLHSTGPLREHKKKSGDVAYYRDSSKDKDVKLYWTIPPQELEALSEETIKLLEIDKEYCQSVKTVVGRLQRLEWLLRNAVVPESYKKYQEQLILRVIDYYKAFSIIEPKNDAPKLSGLQNFAYRLFSFPRSAEEKSLQNKIGNATLLFNSLYMSIVDGIKINDTLLMEGEAELDQDDSCDTLADENPLELLAYHLSLNDQKALCRIIGRNYLEAEELYEDSSEAEELSEDSSSFGPK
ncbi:hypothetical protein [uncultured Legionella sp.]|uniref:hypothetical protein n=1 Tax=uncultured Legionella sp. TaxID=210934 RepID=UPI00261F23BB|nr:hypothetical protein [uncultured Legionella sp.]